MLFFVKSLFAFYKDKIDINLDKLDPFKFMHLLPSISYNNILCLPVSDIVPLVSESALSSTTNYFNPLY